MRSSFNRDDVNLLLKDITGMVKPMGTFDRDKEIQRGRHYCEMLPIEYKPSKKYVEIYEHVLKVFAQSTADAVARVSEMIYREKSGKVVLVSLVRAGTPVGILIKRYLEAKYKIKIPHYSISIIRGKGIDKNAMDYIIEEHGSSNIQFVDGWVGKGAIFQQLKEALKDYPEVNSSIAVLADPAILTPLAGTHEDILIPSSCLNSTVSGLISRSFLREDIISGNDFHGAVYYKELLKEDRTYEFINEIERRFQYNLENQDVLVNSSGVAEVYKIQEVFGIQDINLIKPGIGETTRVLLRRVPWKILVSRKHMNSVELQHILQLAKEKNVEVEMFDMEHYKCCGLIRKMADA